MIYHIDPQSLTIIAGPFAPTDSYVRKLTRCGTPEVFSAEELATFGLVPEVRPELGEYQSYGEPVVTADAVIIHVVDWTDEETHAANLAAARARWAQQAAERTRAAALATATDPSAEVDARLRAVTTLTGA